MSAPAGNMRARLSLAARCGAGAAMWRRAVPAGCGGGSGSGSGGAIMPAPKQVLGLLGAVWVGGGIDYSCALLDDGTARCWGSPGQGQLGDGGTESLTPVQVLGSL
ncbi:MAG: hypothetical protein EXR77_17580 [Myxococcales bacterium]|nr:hypothetical protein [Myxococcales bacterium]